MSQPFAGLVGLHIGHAPYLGPKSIASALCWDCKSINSPTRWSARHQNLKSEFYSRWSRWVHFLLLVLLRSFVRHSVYFVKSTNAVRCLIMVKWNIVPSVLVFMELFSLVKTWYVCIFLLALFFDIYQKCLAEIWGNLLTYLTSDLKILWPLQELPYGWGNWSQLRISLSWVFSLFHL